MVSTNFNFSNTPNIYFGTGKFKELPNIIYKSCKNNKCDKSILLVTGGSFKATQFYKDFMDELNKLGIKAHSVTISGEPTPSFVDEITEKYKPVNINVVVSIGGGSAIDAGKAISAMLLQEGSVTQYLEAKENKIHNGNKVPFIAVPTTSGTGAEATKNAVLSVIGESGYKSSLRHDNFMPDVALIDPILTLTCPETVTAACGLDALTQLLEGYVSTGASPMTDALALSGLEHFKAGFEKSILAGEKDIEAREHMAYASLISGIVLANAGLGVVHGFAGVIGGLYDIPHGVVCGTLLAEVTKTNIEALIGNEAVFRNEANELIMEINEAYDKKDFIPKSCNQQALAKYAKASIILSGKPNGNTVDACRALIELLEEYIHISKINRLGYYQIDHSDIPKIVSKTSNKSNPIKLTSEQMVEILENRI